MEIKDSLFRKEVIEYRYHKSFGTTRINVPPNYRITGYSALMIFFLLSLFICFAKISEKTYIKGYLDSENGIISVESDFKGLVVNVSAKEGSVVHKGDILFVIANKGSIYSHQQDTNLNQQINNLKREYQLRKRHHFALKGLFNKQFVSASTLIKSESSLLEIKNKLKSAEYELLDIKKNRNHIIYAPVSGIITNIFLNQGQSVQPSKPLAHLIPENSKLVARLYAPARKIGYIKPGLVISLKYDAYPPPKFGIYQATIEEINQAVLTDDQEDKPIQIGEPYYKVKAKLKTPYVSANGKKATLSHGLTLTAIVYGEKKKIWQWFFPSFFSL